MKGASSQTLACERLSVDISESFGTRYLHLGSVWVQGAMQIRKPDKLVLDYVQRMMGWLLFVPDEVWRPPGGQAVQLGLGAGSLTRYTARRLGMRSTAVEINADVIAACVAFFDLGRADPRVELVRADAGVWIAEPGRRASIDALMVDLYDAEAAAPVLDSTAFYADCRRALRPGGAMTVNVFGQRSIVRTSLARIGAAFEQVWCFEPTREGNTVIVAVADARPPDAADLRARAARVAAATDLLARRWVKLLRPVAAAAMPETPGRGEGRGAGR
jgi:spermidine synthase